MNIFLRNDTLSWACRWSACRVHRARGLDTNQLRLAGRAADVSTERKGAIIGAPKLYLDFINLF